jgi:hypothetical protein
MKPNLDFDSVRDREKLIVSFNRLVGEINNNKAFATKESWACVENLIADISAAIGPKNNEGMKFFEISHRSDPESDIVDFYALVWAEDKDAAKKTLESDPDISFPFGLVSIEEVETFLEPKVIFFYSEL